MSSSILEVGQVVLAIAVFAYIFYLLAFSRNDASRRDRPKEAKSRHGFERRDYEQVERRVDPNPKPPEGVERRKASGRRQID